MILEDRKRIQGLIKFELQKGTHTYTMCDCGRHGRRTDKCWECWLDILVKGRVEVKDD